MALMLRCFVVVLTLLGSVCSALPRTKPENENNSAANTRLADIISQAGYLAETHQVTTPDGYILTMHRIPYGYDDVKVVPVTVDKPVVFLMHGLSSTSSVFVALAREYAIAYNLADAGFDVWMGNARGNFFSRFHDTLDPDHEDEKFQFFDFSWDDIGAIDLPSMIDYALNISGRGTLHYIGHSQGGTNFLVLNSLRPEYNEKFLSAHLLAGVGYMEYFPDEELIELSQNVDYLYSLALLNGLVELSSGTTTSNSTRSQCLIDPELMNMCDVLQRNLKIDIMINDDDEFVTYIDDIIASFSGSGGASVKQYAHYGQNIQSKLFRRWNYGETGNLATYGTEEPPLYNISLITVNTTMHYTINDYLQDERDVLNMVADMPNCVARRIARDSFEHSDFVAQNDVKELVTDNIIEVITEIERSLTETESYSEEEVENLEEELEEINISEVVVVDLVPDETDNESNSATTVTIGVLILNSCIIIHGFKSLV